MTRKLLSGNEAAARGAYESGVTFAAGYPGTPSTEILETIAEKYKDVIYAEWSPNEKVAFEAAAGAAFSGARVITTMKHVGLNVAADPLMSLAHIGTVGGFVAAVADDPGMHSSQNEQDTRHYARFAKIPILDPADSEEAKEFVKLSMQISEEFSTPVILRMTTRTAHSRSFVTETDRKETGRDITFEKNPPRYIPIPVWGRPMRYKVEERLRKLRDYGTGFAANKIIWNDKKCGIITSGIAYQYVREVFPNASVLKLGMPFPFPDELIKTFAAGVGAVFVVEELDDFLEEHVKALGIACRGKDVIPNIGELSPDVLLKHASSIMHTSIGHTSVKHAQTNAPAANVNADAHVNASRKLPDLPSRPPVLCPGCPHRGIFYALGRLDVVVTGDIGCYSLGVFPPLSRMDTILCMGGGISMAHGIEKAQRGSKQPQKIVGIVGDSTFFHSGITGLLDIAYNKGASTIIVADNRITAMTGYQDNPGSGRTLMGEPTGEISIEAVGRACGLKNVRTIDPRDIQTSSAVLKEAVESPEAWLIISQSPCPQHLRQPPGHPFFVTEKQCRKCHLCLKLGCPGLEKIGDRIRINEFLCSGCGMCRNICPAGAIGT